MKLHPQLSDATFVTRLNRFAAHMRLDGQDVIVHVANSGRLHELLSPENRMWLAPAPAEANRKTAYDLALVEIDGNLVSADARLPNIILREAIEAGLVPEFAGYDTIRQEVSHGNSRLDLMLSCPSGQSYIEVKSVTLVERGVALFPDAPTERGRKHILSLANAARNGARAAVVFVVQRPDARSFSPNEAADPRFCAALNHAIGQGLEAYAYTCEVSRTSIELSQRLPVSLSNLP